MALVNKLFPDDEGFSKKHDIPHTRPANQYSLRMSWHGFRRRRLFYGLAVAVVIYLFIKNLPTDLPPASQRYSPTLGSLAGHARGAVTHDQYSPGDGAQRGKAQGPYDGPLQFPRLGKSLREHVLHPRKDNIVFAALDTASASRLLPLACQMQRHNWNAVHFVLLARSEVTAEDIMKVNGIKQSDCLLTWHDARPDHAMLSSNKRILASIKPALTFIMQGVSPQAILTNDMSQTDANLDSAIQDALSALQLPLIILPSHFRQDLSWIPMLESQSLKRFNDLQIDIVIQPYTQSAGSFIKLLRSIKNAHYDGMPIPRLTIELPSDADPSVLNYLRNFRWPPKSTGDQSKLTIRRRIDLKSIPANEAALRVIESFYPTIPSSSHILMLDPDMELAPTYMHYLMYTILSYKHGTRSEPESERLFGISLELPQERLDGSVSTLASASSSQAPFVLAQAPNSHAALYFGDRWSEFHSFLSLRLAHDPELKKAPLSGDILISKQWPQWLTHAHEIMQACGWYMLFPSPAQTGRDSMAVHHKGTARAPDEFAHLKRNKQSGSTKASDASYFDDTQDVLDDVGTTDSSAESIVSNADHVLPAFLSVDAGSAERSRMPTLLEMDLLSAAERKIRWEDLAMATAKYSEDFSHRFGGCTTSGATRMGEPETVEHLFCRKT